MPAKSGKGTIRRSHALSTGGKGKGKGGAALSSAGTGTHHKSRKEKSGTRKSARQKQQQQWHYYINKIRRNTHKDYSLSRRSMAVLGSFVEDMFERLATEAVNVAHISKVKTLTGREIQMAVRLLMGGELRKYGMCEGTRAVHSYNTNFNALLESRNTQAI